jgi:hypothetical protein
MISALPHPTGQVRHLTPFILLSLSLHLALLFALRLPMHTPSVASPRPLIVSFASPLAAERPRDELSPIQRVPVKLLTNNDTTEAEPVRSDATPLPDAPLNMLLETARSIARDEAKIAEQEYAAQERQKLTTPAAALEKFLRKPYKKASQICFYRTMTPLGEFCFTSEAFLKLNSAEAFGVPTDDP